MSILLLTELFDDLNSYKSFEYENETFESIAESFKSKASGVHAIFAFKCDHIILNKLPHLSYKINRVYNNTTVKNYMLQTKQNIIKLEDILFNKYDIVWCRDDILINIKELKIKYPKILFVYENVEHAFSIYNKHYDLILDHTNFNFAIPNKLNTSVSFPYPINKDYLRKHLSTEKINDIFMDNRDFIKYVTILRKDKLNGYTFLTELFKKYDLSFKCNIMRPEQSFNPHKNNKYDTSTVSYLKKIAQSKYFVLTFPRLGQSLVEAAALKCIVLGTKKSINSPFVCHPTCIFEKFASIEKLINKIKTIESNSQLQKEIIEYQDNMIQKYFYEHQKNILSKALELKRNSI